MLTRFPSLRFVLIEGGFAWLPPLMWRLDRAWRKLRAEVPRPRPARPRSSIRERFWVTTQPMEEPERPGQYLELLEQLAMDDRIMFSTDYPHWDFDSPDRGAARRSCRADMRRGILHDNAAALYDLTPAQVESAPIARA